MNYAYVKNYDMEFQNFLADNNGSYNNESYQAWFTSYIENAERKNIEKRNQMTIPKEPFFLDLKGWKSYESAKEAYDNQMMHLTYEYERLENEKKQYVNQSNISDLYDILNYSEQTAKTANINYLAAQQSLARYEYDLAVQKQKEADSPSIYNPDERGILETIKNDKTVIISNTKASIDAIKELKNPGEYAFTLDIGLEAVYDTSSEWYWPTIRLANENASSAATAENSSSSSAASSGSSSATAKPSASPVAEKTSETPKKSATPAADTAVTATKPAVNPVTENTSSEIKKTGVPSAETTVEAPKPSVTETKQSATSSPTKEPTKPAVTPTVEKTPAAPNESVTPAVTPTVETPKPLLPEIRKTEPTPEHNDENGKDENPWYDTKPQENTLSRFVADKNGIIQEVKIVYQNDSGALYYNDYIVRVTNNVNKAADSSIYFVLGGYRWYAADKHGLSVLEELMRISS